MYKYNERADINARKDAGKTNAWLTLQPPFTVVLKAGEHSCRMIHASREIWMIALSTRCGRRRSNREFATSSPQRLRARVLRVFSCPLHLPSCLLSLLIVARTGSPSLSLPLSLSVLLSLSTTIYECSVFLGPHEYQCASLPRAVSMASSCA
jgi:hypothetical protein